MTQYKRIWFKGNALNEIAQHLAQSLGYTKPAYILHGDIIFNPNDKSINHRSGVPDPKSVDTVVTIEKLFDFLKAPTVLNPRLTSKDGEVTAEVLGGGVMFWRFGTETQLFVPQDLINKLSGNRGLPLVRFSYPDSTNQWMTLLREVQVTKFDSEWLCGMETMRGCEVVDHPTFKKYDARKIKGLHFYEFIQHPKD